MLIIAGISGFASDILYHPSQITGTMKSAGMATVRARTPCVAGIFAVRG
jgi:hypothetical protein